MITESEFDNLKVGDELIYVYPDKNEPVLVTVTIVDDKGFVFLNNQGIITKYCNERVFSNLHDALQLQNYYFQQRITTLQTQILENQKKIILEKNKYINDLNG